MSLQVTRFPDVSQNPVTITEIARAIRIIQTAIRETLPSPTALPAKGVIGQVVVVDGGTANGFLYVHNGTSWVLSSATSLIGAVSSTPGLFVTSGTISQFAATASQNGYLTAVDWAIFSAKQAALAETSCSLTSGGAISLTNNAPVNIGTLTVSPGYWKPEALVKFAPSAASTSDFKVGISGVSATFSGDQKNSISQPFIATGLTDTYDVQTPATARFDTRTAGGNSLLYVVAQATFSLGSVTAYGSGDAIRIG